jgi:hypothetical protein
VLTIYSARTGRIRRRISDAVLTDGELLEVHAPGPGEHVFEGPELTQEELNELTGIVPSNDRYVVLRQATSEVVRHLIADPDCGDSCEPGHELVAHPIASYRWRMLPSGVWQRSQKEILHDFNLARRQRTAMDNPAFRARQAADPEGASPAEIDAAIAVTINREFVFKDELEERQRPILLLANQ